MIEIYNRAQHAAEVIRLGHRMLIETVFACWPFDDEMVLAYLDRPAVFCCLSKVSDEYAGMVIASLGQMFFSPKIIAFEEVLYVAPEYRGGVSALRLVEKTEEWAKHALFREESAELHLTQRTGIEPERTRRFFDTLGYETVGYVTRKVLPCATPAIS